jgi:hypothetical protein
MLLNTNKSQEWEEGGGKGKMEAMGIRKGAGGG